MEDAMSPQRHLDRVRALVVSYGTWETPGFIRQAKEFAAVLKSTGKPVELVVGGDFFHQDMWESLGNPDGPNGRAVWKMIGL